MPRKKEPPKFKYTVRREGILYVKFPLPGSKYPVWRICRDETQEAVNDIIEQIKVGRAKELVDSVVPERCKDFFAYFFESVKKRISERTLQKYEHVIRLYLTPAIGDLQLSAVKLLHIQNIYKEMSERGLEPLTVKKIHSVASSIFKEAVHLDLIAKSPVARAKTPKLKLTEKIKTLSGDEVKRFLNECQGSDYGIIFEFALETGMRPQEYLALRWTDIDLTRKTAEVTRALVYDRKGGGFYFKEPKTRRSRRTIPLSLQLCDKLLVHKEKQTAYLDEINERVRRRCKPSRINRRAYNKTILENHKKLNLVFPSQKFTPIKDINLGRRYFKKIAEDAGLSPSLALYSLRHSCATLLLSANVNPKIVSERLGHASIALTLDTYSHVLPTMQEDATEALSDLLYHTTPT